MLRPRTSATPNLTLDSEGKCESDVIGAFFHWKMPASQCRSNCETFKCDFKVPKRYCSLNNNVSVGFMQSMLSTHTSKAMRPCLRGGGRGRGANPPIIWQCRIISKPAKSGFFSVRYDRGYTLSWEKCNLLAIITNTFFRMGAFKGAHTSLFGGSNGGGTPSSVATISSRELSWSKMTVYGVRGYTFSYKTNWVSILQLL